MKTRREWSIYVGRLVKCLRVRDVKGMFEGYGRMLRCDIKYGTEMAYAFIDFQDREAAEDCIKYENGREVNGQNIIVEWAKGRKDKKVPVRRSDPDAQKLDVCFRCRRMGHWARNCPEPVGYARRVFAEENGGDRSRSPIRRDEPGQVDPEPLQVDPEPGQVDLEPGQVDPEPGQVDPEPGQVNPEPVQVDSSVDHEARP
ncbi:hypothetical protein BsWGS_08106 [Bradybaena similaris]